MLYLMMSKTDKEYLVKIGYSNRGVERRRREYYSHNPRAIMRSSCAGSRAMETGCREKLTELGAERIPRTEWFTVSKESFDILYEKGMSLFRPKHQPIHFLEEFE